MRLHTGSIWSWLLLGATGCSGGALDSQDTTFAAGSLQGHERQGSELGKTKQPLLNSTAGVVTVEYREPAGPDPEVSPYPVELWASFYRPESLEPGRRYPLLIFLHGNHPTCGRIGTSPRVDDNNQYADTGGCPKDYDVVRNHRGYDYIAEDLAARGYFVLSVNANRTHHSSTIPAPADDLSFIRERGRLVLRHLHKMSLWNSGVEDPPEVDVDLRNRFDFSEVGLFGHSRGGQSVRFAYNEYRSGGSIWPGLIGPVNFRGIFEVGPTDDPVGDAPLNALGTRWNVLVPGCDWDLDTHPGFKPFDRMIHLSEESPEFKSIYFVWGANHNFYNTEWQQADTHPRFSGCVNHPALFEPGAPGSERQRETGRASAVAFFTANVGATRDESGNAVFDPAFPLPFDYRVDRAYHPGGDATYSLMLEDFLRPTGTSSHGLPTQTSGDLTDTHGGASFHDPIQKQAALAWTTSGDSTYWQTNWDNVGATGLDLSGYQYLDVRLDRGSLDEMAPAALDVRLVSVDDQVSEPVSTAEFVPLTSPPRGRGALPTARIPLERFTGVDLAHTRGVRLSFPSPIPRGPGVTPPNGVLVANIRATRATTTPAPAAAARILAGDQSSVSVGASVGPSVLNDLSPARITSGNRIISVERQGSDSVEVTLATQRHFHFGANALVLSIGQERSRKYSHPNGDLYRVKFIFTRQAWSRLSPGQEITVRPGEDASSVWDFGRLGKSQLLLTR